MKHITMALLFCGLGISMLAGQNVTTITEPSTKIDDDIIFDRYGNLFGSNYVGSRVWKRTADGEESVFVSGVGSPNGIAFNDDGTFILADNTGNKLFKVFPDGTKEIFKDSVPGPSGMLRMENSDTILVTTYTGHKIWKLAPNGSMTEYLTHPQFKGPVGLCYDDNHNLYIANFSDRKIFKVSPGGQPEFLTQPPLGVNIGFLAYSKGFLYATAFQAHKIYKIDLNGNYDVWLGSTAGTTDGNAATAKFFQPNGIRFSTTGDSLYVSDFGSKRVRLITDLSGSSSIKPASLAVWSCVIAPNPVAEVANISITLETTTELAIGLYDLRGHLVYQVLSTGTINQGAHFYEFDCSSLPKGVYSLQVQSPDRVAAHKIVVD